MKDEHQIQREISLGAAQAGIKLWRNNVGVLMDRDGRPVRYGLANDSSAMNKVLKSGDLIGFTPKTCPVCASWRVAVFTSIEAKHSGWTYSGSNREVAQAAWADLVIRHGGLACMAPSWEDVRRLWQI